jgi:hypothetical protein
MDVKGYWQEVRAIERGLPAFVWLVSLEDARRGRKGGSIVEVAAAGAGALLYAKSHRIAGEEEVRAHRAGEASAKREAFETERRRRGIAVVAVKGESKR